MKITEHVEHLLRQGRKPKELIDLGFPKRVVTRVRRRLREEKAMPRLITRQAKTEMVPLREATAVQCGLKSLETRVNQLESQVDILEAVMAGLYDMDERLDGTPALGLKHHFKCDCGASGLVALHIQCTKCGKETWWGWFPKE